jgi:hypothetical protein
MQLQAKRFSDSRDFENSKIGTIASFMEQSPTWEANGFAASKEISRI